jgi:hypothetical protein
MNAPIEKSQKEEKSIALTPKTNDCRFPLTLKMNMSKILK